MHFLSPLLLVAAAATLSSAGDVLRSTSLRTCMVNSGFTATLFNVSFTPEDGRLIIHINGGSTVTGRVTAKLTVLAYGFPVIEQLINPCDTPDLTAMCPLTILPLDWTLTRTVPESTRKQIPAIAYKIPDLDGVARMEVINDLGKVVACVEAPLSNGQTVEHSFVGWITALISAAALVASAVVSGMGHSSTAAHLAANALSLFTYFQAQAMVAMMAVPLPPLAAAWSQNFNWALGVIRVKFMQRIFHWYVLATGGTTTNLFKEQELVSVQILKRDTVDVDPYLRSRAASYGFAQAARLMPRSNSGFVVYYPTEVVKVTGIDRMSYKAKIEASNLFMTGMSFYVALFCLVLIVVSGFRLLCKTSAITKHDRFREFRAKWLVVLKGIMYRIILIGFPPIMVLSSWEFLRRDSPAVVVLAVFFFASLLVTVSWACVKILTIGKHSSTLAPELGPAYTLYSDPAALNRWGYLYVQFRTQTYYYILPQLTYLLAKCLAIGTAQNHGTAQSVVVLVLDVFYLIAVSILRPWLDRRTNIINIAIAATNALNSIMVFIFSGVTGAPAMVPGVFGVVFFIANAVFALILMVLLGVATVIALCSKDPEERYACGRGVGVLPLSSEAGLGEKRRDLDADPTRATGSVTRKALSARSTRSGVSRNTSPSARGQGDWNVGAGYER